MVGSGQKFFFSDFGVMYAPFRGICHFAPESLFGTFLGTGLSKIALPASHKALYQPHQKPRYWCQILIREQNDLYHERGHIYPQNLEKKNFAPNMPFSSFSARSKNLCKRR